MIACNFSSLDISNDQNIIIISSSTRLIRKRIFFSLNINQSKNVVFSFVKFHQEDAIWLKGC